MEGERGRVLWTPGNRHAHRLGRFADRMEQHHGLTLPDHESLWRWSVENLEQFWVQSSTTSASSFTIGQRPR